MNVRFMESPQLEDHILLVDDQPDLARDIQMLFTEHGFQVQTATTGNEAIRQLTQPFDLMVLDWMLPDMSGLTVLKKLRDISGIPVLMVTARGNEMDRVTGLEWGADDYLVKPFGQHELIARVRALLRRSRMTQSQMQKDSAVDMEACSYNELTLDKLSHRVLLKGQELHLTPREFHLLKLFVVHPQRVFSRNYLLETLWDGVTFGCDRAVDNAVLRLRKKLEGWQSRIETVWGVGYRLASDPTASAS